MASEEDFDVEKDLPRFLAEVLDKFDYLFQGNFDVEAAEVHAEVLDQTISLIRSLKDCFSLDKRDKDSITEIWILLLRLLEMCCVYCVAVLLLRQL